jgi:hypothetical protein
MSRNPQVRKAFAAMAAIGISEEQVKPVLKNLLRLYDKDWSLIEAEEYRALADAIFEAEDAKVDIYIYIYICFFLLQGIFHLHFCVCVCIVPFLCVLNFCFIC